MTKQIYAEGLKAGDLILISYNNYLHAGVYLGESKKNNPLFIGLWRNTDSLENILEKGGGIYKNYIIRGGENILAKISEEGVSAHIKEKYNKVLDLLNKYEII